MENARFCLNLDLPRGKGGFSPRLSVWVCSIHMHRVISHPWVWFIWYNHPASKPAVYHHAGWLKLALVAALHTGLLFFHLRPPSLFGCAIIVLKRCSSETAIKPFWSSCPVRLHWSEHHVPWSLQLLFFSKYCVIIANKKRSKPLKYVF